MRCPRCKHDNPEGARFCNQCAQAMLPGASFPIHLGGGAPVVRSASEGERKQVSVLFADMKGSMELLSGRDPEEARQILDPMLEHMMEAVHHYGGTVNQVMGDGIMALFGAPIALEEHAVRACCAALRMQASVVHHNEALRRAGATPVQIRVGINSGEVVVRSIDSDLHMDYSAVGQATHLAARMEQAARPGSILITAETLHLAQEAMQVEPLGQIRVAGLSEPVSAHELVGPTPVRGRLQAAARRGLARFVGRENEMRALISASDLAVQRRGQIVTVIGEAGVGKSRLLHEFVHGDHTRGWLVLETGCLSYDKARGYRPVIDALQVYFAIEARDDASRIRDRVSAKLLSLDRSLGADLPALWALLDVLPGDSLWPHLDLGHRRQAILEAFKRLVLHECQVQPVALVFEDLHLVDEESAAVLDALIEDLPGASLLLLASCRPSVTLRWRERSIHRRLLLDPLPRASAEDLLDTLLGPATELRQLRQQLIDRTEGNPFFISECVSTMAQTGVLAGAAGAYRIGRTPDALKIPATVHAMLAARIDHLAPEDKQLLEAAAVIGRDVPLALLRSVCGPEEDSLRSTLARLQAGELLQEAALFPDLVYTFKHALTHEVSYASLLGKRRRELHARIVAAIEGLQWDRIDDQVEKLAHHALRGELTDKAIAYLGRAGDKAVLRSAYHEAVGLFDQALELVATLPETRETLTATLKLRTGLGPALRADKGDWDPEVEKCYSQSLDLFDRLDAASGRFPILVGLWACHYSRGEYERALDWATQLLQLADKGNGQMRFEARGAMWATTIAGGRPAQALSLPPPTPPFDRGHRSPWSSDGSAGIWVYEHEIGAIGILLLGQFDRARDSVVRGEQLARQANHSLMTVLAHHSAALVYYHRGERGTAMLHAKAASSLGRACGVVGWPEHASIILARLLADEGRASEAIRLAEANLPNSLRAGWPWSASVSFGLVADLYGRVGQPAKGLAMFRSLEPKHYGGLYGAELHRLHAELLLAVTPGARDEAETHLTEALALARERQLKTLELRAAVSLAQFVATRDRRAARAVLSVADAFEEGLEVTDLRTARTLREWLA